MAQRFFLTALKYSEILSHVQEVLTPNCVATVTQVIEKHNSVVGLYEVQPLNGKFSPKQFERVEIYFLIELRKNTTSDFVCLMQFVINTKKSVVVMHKARVEYQWVHLSFQLNVEAIEVFQQLSNACESELERLTGALTLDSNENNFKCKYLNDDRSGHCFPTSYNGVFKIIIKGDRLGSSRNSDDEIKELLNGTCYQKPLVYSFIIFCICFILLFSVIGTCDFYMLCTKIYAVINRNNVSPF